MDYAFPQRRKNKNDKRAKRKFNKYKSGGQHRSSNITLSNTQNSK